MGVRFAHTVTEIAPLASYSSSPSPPPEIYLDPVIYNEDRLRLRAALDVPDIWFFLPPPKFWPIFKRPIADEPLIQLSDPQHTIWFSGEQLSAPPPVLPARNGPFSGAAPASRNNASVLGPSSGEGAAQPGTNVLKEMIDLQAANRVSDWIREFVEHIEKIRKQSSKGTAAAAWTLATNDVRKRQRFLDMATMLHHICDWVVLPNGKVDETQIPFCR